MMATVPHLTVVQMAGGAVAGLLTLALVYGLVFLSLAGATPGMMYAEIGLYQFDTTDRRPGTLRLWLLLTLLSALPAGLDCYGRLSIRMGWGGRIGFVGCIRDWCRRSSK